MAPDKAPEAEWSPFIGDCARGFLCGHPETQDNGRPLLQPDPRLTQGLSLFHFVTQRMTAGLFPNYFPPTSGLGMSAGGGTKSSRLAGKRKIQQGNASLLERAPPPQSNLSVNAGAVMKRDAQSKGRVSKARCHALPDPPAPTLGASFDLITAKSGFP